MTGRALALVPCLLVAALAGAGESPAPSAREIDVAGSKLALAFRQLPPRTKDYRVLLEIDVARRGRRIQRLRVDSICDPRMEGFLWTDDIDFDGNADLGVCDEFGGKWHGYHFFLFDPRSGRFVENDLSRRLGEALGGNGYEVDPENHTVTQYFLNAGCGQVESMVHKVENGHVELYEQVECGVSESGDTEVVRTLRRVDGEMRVVAVTMRPRFAR